MARLFDDAALEFAEYAGAVVSDYPFTMSAWFYVDDLAVDCQIIGMSIHSAANQYVRLLFNGATAGDNLICQISNTTSSIARTSTGVSPGVWMHGCAVCESATSRSVYLNGAGKGTDSVSRAMFTPTRTTIGRLTRTSPTNYMSGGIAFPCIHSAALSDDDVAQLAASFHPTMVRPDAIVALWEFDAGASPEPDHWGGYSLTLTGTTQVDDPPLIYPCGPLSVSASASGGGGATPWLYARRQSQIIGGGMGL